MRYHSAGNSSYTCVYCTPAAKKIQVKPHNIMCVLHPYNTENTVENHIICLQVVSIIDSFYSHSKVIMQSFYSHATHHSRAILQYTRYMYRHSLVCSHFAVIIQSLYSLQSLCSHHAVITQSSLHLLYSHYIVIIQSLYSHYIVIIQALYSHYIVILVVLQSLYSQSTVNVKHTPVTAPLVHNHNTVRLQSFQSTHL